jgi:hypothetical protein
MDRTRTLIVAARPWPAQQPWSSAMVAAPLGGARAAALRPVLRRCPVLNTIDAMLCHHAYVSPHCSLQLSAFAKALAWQDKF